MKIIGQNSVSGTISKIFLVLFILLSLMLFYELIGFAVCYYNYITNSRIVSDFFIIGNDVGWTQNQWTKPLNETLKFKMFVPFTKANFLTGLFTPGFVFFKIFSGTFFTMFCWYAFKIFQHFGRERVFTPKIVSTLKNFAVLNLLYFPCLILINFINLGSASKSSTDSLTAIFKALSDSLAYFILGILIIFAIEFFKRGYELQSENDLTI